MAQIFGYAIIYLIMIKWSSSSMHEEEYIYITYHKNETRGMRRNKHRRVCFGDRVRLGVHVWPLINQWVGLQVYPCMCLLILGARFR